jgi:hypothetical protein
MEPLSVFEIVVIAIGVVGSFFLAAQYVLT